MPSCKTCAHPDRAEIDRLLVDPGGPSERTVADRYSIPRSSLRRHRLNHIPETLARASEKKETAIADDLLGEIERLYRRANGLLAAAARSGDLKTAVSAIGQARATLDLLAKVAGRIGDGSTTVNVTNVRVEVDAVVLQIQGAILGALDPFPEAKIAAADALAALSAENRSG